jgi:hypothetical protein
MDFQPPILVYCSVILLTNGIRALKVWSLNPFLLGLKKLSDPIVMDLNFNIIYQWYQSYLNKYSH